MHALSLALPHSLTRVPEMRFVSTLRDEESHRVIHQVPSSAATLVQQWILHASPELQVRAAMARTRETEGGRQAIGEGKRGGEGVEAGADG